MQYILKIGALDNNLSMFHIVVDNDIGVYNSIMSPFQLMSLACDNSQNTWKVFTLLRYKTSYIIIIPNENYPKHFCWKKLRS